MKLDKYIEQSIEELKNFKEEWIKNNQSDSETFPLEMSEDEWKSIEQLERF